MNGSPARQHFSKLIRLPEEHLPLAEAALCIAWEDQQEGHPDAGLQQLDAIAGAVRLQIEDLTDPHAVVEALNDYLFNELGFRGNSWDYYNVENSYLDRVLETRIGLPITLSVIYMEVGWRLGLPISGVALPGHFIARYTTAHSEIFIDPFNQGHLWSRSECEQRVATVYGNATPTMLQQVLEPPTKRDILKRILRNLKNIHFQNEDFTQALGVVERLLLLTPEDPQELRDRGLLRARLDQLPAALDDLERYAQRVPDALDLPELQQYAGILAARLAAGN